MSRQIFYLIFINICSAIGYSLIAPLYAPEAEKRGMKESICGIVIAIYAASNFFSTSFVPGLISMYGRRNIFYIATILEAGCTLACGMLYYISDYYTFLIISLISRLVHGIGASFSATLGVGIALGPICASFFFFVGGYTLPFYIIGTLIFFSIPLIYSLDLPLEEENLESPKFLNALFKMNVLSVVMTVVMDVFTKSFYFPTFTLFLVNKFNLSIEESSILFVVHVISYLITLSYINKIISRFGFKLSISFGLICNFIGTLLLPPIPLFPQSILVVIIGLLMLGVPGALISVSGICDLMGLIKFNHPEYDESITNDMASAIYNIAVNLGEALGPSFGGYITEKTNFQRSCEYTSLFNICVCVVFLIYNLEDLNLGLKERKKSYESFLQKLDNPDKNIQDLTLIGLKNRSGSYANSVSSVTKRKVSL